MSGKRCRLRQVNFSKRNLIFHGFLSIMPKMDILKGWYRLYLFYVYLSPGFVRLMIVSSWKTPKSDYPSQVTPGVTSFIGTLRNNMLLDVAGGFSFYESPWWIALFPCVRIAVFRAQTIKYSSQWLCSIFIDILHGCQSLIVTILRKPIDVNVFGQKKGILLKSTVSHVDVGLYIYEVNRGFGTSFISRACTSTQWLCKTYLRYSQKSRQCSL